MPMYEKLLFSPVPDIHAPLPPRVLSVIFDQSAFPSIIARRRSIMTEEASVHLPLSLCFTKTLSSFIVSASAAMLIAGSIVSTSASTSARLSILFFILPSRCVMSRVQIIVHPGMIGKQFQRIFTFPDRFSESCHAAGNGIYFGCTAAIINRTRGFTSRISHRCGSSPRRAAVSVRLPQKLLGRDAVKLCQRHKVRSAGIGCAAFPF